MCSSTLPFGSVVSFGPLRTLINVPSLEGFVFPMTSSVFSFPSLYTDVCVCKFEDLEFTYICFNRSFTVTILSCGVDSGPTFPLSRVQVRLRDRNGRL